MSPPGVPTSPDGSVIEVRPIRRQELGKVLIRCFPDGGTIENLFKTQEVIGMGAWDGDQCIAQLHCYRLTLPHGFLDSWPAWNRPFYLGAVLDGCLGIEGAVWCHACCHVGRSVESFSHSDAPDSRYFGRGIGTALCQASVRWAREHDYRAVLAPGTPAGLMEFSRWAGGLPWTTYQKLGFSDAGLDQGHDLPDWAKGNSPPDVMKEVQAALAAGRTAREFQGRLMVLKINER